MPDTLFTITIRMGFNEDDRRAIAKWWVESGQARWDKHAEPDSLACYMEVDEFIKECVRGNLNALREEMRAAAALPKKSLKVRARPR